MWPLYCLLCSNREWKLHSSQFSKFQYYPLISSMFFLSCSSYLQPTRPVRPKSSCSFLSEEIPGWVLGVGSGGGYSAGCKATRAWSWLYFPFSAEVKNGESCTSNPFHLDACMACKDQFYFNFLLDPNTSASKNEISSKCSINLPKTKSHANAK
jgi:hypothetical protein